MGLAIVKKIMEDHQGDLVLEDGEPLGARVRLVFATAEPRIADRPDTGGQPRELSTVSNGA